MRIGIFAKAFARPTLEQTLDAVAAHGLTEVQFNLSCVDLPTLPEAIARGLCERIAGAFRERGLTMAAISGTFNLIHPDRSHRDEMLVRLNTLAEACRLLGTSVVTLCSGTRDPRDMWRRHKDNNGRAAWSDLTESLRTVAAIAEAWGVTMAFEPEVANVVDSACKARRVLDEVDSDRLKVVIDPANLFHKGELSRMGEVLDETFELLGPDVALAHAKDLTRDGEAGHEAAGQGVLDYDRYLRLLRDAGYDGPLILHGLAETQVAGSVSFLREKLGELKVS